MTCALDLYKKAGGTIRRSSVATLAVGTGERNTTVVTGVSGKRIVPVWLLFTYTGTGVALKFSLRGSATASANRENQIIDTQFIDLALTVVLPYFVNFDGFQLRALADGESLRFTFWSGSSAGLSAAKATVGYYLIDV